MHAAMGGKLEVVKVLVEAGADLEHASLVRCDMYA